MKPFLVLVPLVLYSGSGAILPSLRLCATSATPTAAGQGYGREAGHGIGRFEPGRAAIASPPPNLPWASDATGGNVSPARFEFTQVHMGLPVRTVLHAGDEQAARRAAAAAFDRIATLDNMMSDYRPDSDVRRIARRAGEAVSVSREVFMVVQHAVEIARLTGGAFDPTMAPLVTLWRDARQTGRPPAPSALDIARSKVGWRHIELDPALSTIRLPLPGMALDLGGIAKGYILQEALRILRLHGVPRALIESGGDIVVGDAPPDRPGWAIEVAGADAAFAQRASRLTNVALASSGAGVQFVVIDGVRYSHVIDPRTGLGVTSSRTARVIADDAATADALATALTVLESSAAAEVRSRFPGVMVSVQESTRELPELAELPKLPGLQNGRGNLDDRRKSVDSGNF